MPFSAPLPVPTIMAVGVARPSAHGQAITKTDIKIVKENWKLAPPISNQARPDTRAIALTTGTK